jgi:mannose-6-phosphate isomerase
MNELLPPLKFVPLIKPLTWGGRKLESLFRKRLPIGTPCGESWEVVDLPGDQSVVSEGTWAGHCLDGLVRERPEELLGETELLQGRFPLLFKYIDAHQTLSVQVHPDGPRAEKLGGGARPKTEAWYILQSEPGAKLYLGLREGCGRPELDAALADGSVADLLHAVEVEPGQFYFLPSGALHAIGAGIVLAEIQQSSDTTYRVFDWNRVGLDGKPRQLHVEQALASIHYDKRGQLPAAPPRSGRPGVRCELFSFERVGLSAGSQVPLIGGRPHIVACLEGNGELVDSGVEPVGLALGETCLLPACRTAQLTSAEGGVFLVVRA